MTEERKKVVIEVQSLSDCYTPLIISHKTGVWYTDQVGGYACYHPEEEGFLIYVSSSYADKIDSCKLLCLAPIGIEFEDEDISERKAIADEINKLLLSAPNGYKDNMRIDYERLDWMTEGWIPVLYKMHLYHWDKYDILTSEGPKDAQELAWVKGILCTGNCD